MGAASCKKQPCGCEEETIFACSPNDLSTSEHQPTSYHGAEAMAPGDTVTLAGARTPNKENPESATEERAADATERASNIKRSLSWKVLLAGGATYEGPWLGSEKHGQGTLVLPDGTRYTGQFQRDQKSGYGTYSYPSGSTYSGQWGNDLQNGHGTENWADGSTFEGQFAAGEKHGWGRFVWGNGCLYEGEFERNDMHGEGSYAWSDGRMYSGQWARNFMGPSGSMQWPDGRVYDGEFQDGRKHGEGTHWWPDGRSYKGQWRDGRQHGTGVARTAKGMECKGLWQDGKFVKWLDMITPGSETSPRAPPMKIQPIGRDGGGDTAAGIAGVPAVAGEGTAGSQVDLAEPASGSAPGGVKDLRLVPVPKKAANAAAAAAAAKAAAERAALDGAQGKDPLKQEDTSRQQAPADPGPIDVQ